MAKYPYIVNKDGVWYPAGTEVPADILPSENVDVAEKREYSKTEINRMAVADLKKLASELDIEDIEDMTGARLKKCIIEALGL